MPDDGEGRNEKYVFPVVAALVVVAVIVLAVLVAGSGDDTAFDDGPTTSLAGGTGTGSPESGSGSPGSDGGAEPGDRTAITGPVEPIELDPGLLDEAVQSGAPLFPELVSADRDQLGALVISACEAVQSIPTDPTRLAEGVDAVVAAMPQDTGIAQYTPGALLAIAYYVRHDGCGSGAIAEVGGSEFLRRFGEHRLDP